MNTLKKLQSYAGNRKALFPVSMILSALSALAGLLPYIIIWLIVRELFETGGGAAGNSKYDKRYNDKNINVAHYLFCFCNILTK
ncbi:MAG: hypothetical protein LBC68_07370 [Prevotellaceae bacterium]|jgi:hypothetical protein|nr:hypothetical protein [Prevotellaceae bacterium]